MRTRDARVWSAVLALACGAALAAAPQQAARETEHADASRSLTGPLVDPLAGQPEAIASGQAIFKLRCARCHGIDARGFSGPDLAAGDQLRAQTDADIFRTIKGGVPGTEMPPTSVSDNEIWRLVTYVRSIRTPAAEGDRFALAGDAANGERIFWGAGGCGQCHRVAPRGGHLGPDFSSGLSIRSAAARDALARDIRQPSHTIKTGFETVRIVTADGRQIRGVRRNEDTFSIQIIDTGERMLSFLKSELQKLSIEPQSLMPSYAASQLTDADIADLLKYLDSVFAARRRAQ